MGWLGPSTWFNPPKLGLQSAAVCALFIANIEFTNGSIVSLFNALDFIVFDFVCVLFYIFIT